MIKLVGILVVALGFGFRINALLVVLVAGVATGLAAGLSPREVAALIGKLFVDNRNLTLALVLMLPVVGLLEKHGLQQRVAGLMRQARAATAGRVLLIYQALRGGFSVFGISLGNHAGMVRPLVAPMAEGAARERGELSEQSREKIRAHAAAAENVGNFFSDDVVVAVGALLLVKGFFDAAGVPVTLAMIQLWSLPTAGWVVLVGWWRYRALDRGLVKHKEDGK